MPRHPQVGSVVGAMAGSVFSALAHKLQTYPGEVYPLHVGDTWMEPAEGCRMQDLTVAEHPGMHRYAAPQGLHPLVEEIVDRISRRTSASTAGDNVLVAAGATGSIGAAIGAITEPGEEIIVLAPYWPLIVGIIQSFHGVPVEVDLFGAADSPETCIEAIEPHLSSKTAAIYVSTPNNPSGRLIPRKWLEAICAWAAQNDLWILSDEVYEEYVYAGEHAYCRELDPERTFSVHSFSKSFGMAGNRCGYVVGPADVMGDVRKVSTHSFYSTPTASQLAGLHALQGAGDAWVEMAKPLYRELGIEAARRLGEPEPEGSQFLFLDIADHLDERGLLGFLEDAAERGLFLAPGPSFGPYPTHVRLCYTAAAPDVTRRGVEELARLLDR